MIQVLNSHFYSFITIQIIFASKVTLAHINVNFIVPYTSLNFYKHVQNWKIVKPV